MTFYFGFGFGILIGVICGGYLVLTFIGKLNGEMLKKLVDEGFITRGRAE